MGLISWRCDEDLQARLDAMPGSRSEKLKAAVEAYVGGLIPVTPADGDEVEFDWEAERAEIERERAVLAKEREALLAERAARPVVASPGGAVRSPVGRPSPGRTRAQEAALELLPWLDRSKSARTLVAETGWLEMRVDRALARLLASGQIECVEGQYRRVG